MKNSGIGGQAVLEGIMMKNKDKYAVAVRKPDKEIELCVKDYKSVTDKCKLFKLPFIRGVFNFVDSMILGVSTLMFSAKFFDEEEEQEVKSKDKKKDKKNDEVKPKDVEDKTESVIMTITMIVSLFLAVGLFIVLPSLISDLFKNKLDINSYTAVSIIEGLIRITLFVLYVFLISRMEDIQRTFMYHGAEHKCINCIEHGKELTVENVLNSSRLHKRCGTSFLFLVMAISMIFFILIPVEGTLEKVIVRLVLVPVIAGVSYEVLKLAGRYDGIIIRIISAPGMALQRLTTKEPDAEMAEVAIKAVEAVFDWREFLADYKEEK